MIWKIIGNVMSFMGKCKRDKINAYSAQSAFFIILSLIPFLMVFSSLLQYTSVTEGTLLKIIERVMPEYIAPFLISLIDEVYNRSAGIISITAIVAIWSAAKGVQYMTDGLNSVNDLEETRNWLVLRMWAVVYTVIFLVAIVFTLLVIVFGNSLQKLASQYIPLLRHAVDLLAHFRGLIMLVMLIVFFDVIFTALPNKKLTFKSQLPGAAICGVAWYIFSIGVSIYVDYFNGFSMYGSLTTIALIMLWLYFCMYIMMMSAEVNVIFNDSIRKWLLKEKEKKKRKNSVYADATEAENITMLPSAFSTVEKQEDGTYLLSGGGYGHGLGMSQNGANGMAKAGMGYQDILNYFYQDITVETIGEMEGKETL